MVREPGGTPVAEAVRQRLLESAHAVAPAAELFLFLAARADLAAQVIRPALEAGRVVLADRFTLSTVAYQVAGRGLRRGTVRPATRPPPAGSGPTSRWCSTSPGVGRGRQEAAGEGAGSHRPRAGRVSRTGLPRPYAALNGPGLRHIDGTWPGERLLDAAWHGRDATPGRTFGGSHEAALGADARGGGHLVLFAAAGCCSEAEHDGGVYRSARLFDDVLPRVQNFYVDCIGDSLYQMATDGLLDELHDPYSVC